MQLCQFPKIIKEAADTLSPAVLAQYVFVLARAYNKMYGALPILSSASPTSRAFRVYLSATVARIIRKGMRLLGIEVPERM